MTNRTLIIWLFSALAPLLATGQEYLTGTAGNPVLREAGKDLLMKSGLQEGSVSLPFSDDFSGKSPYPDNSLWIDNEAFINKGYPFRPLGNGVATLDVIDSMGFVHNNMGTFAAEADHLTSRPIRMDSVFDDASQSWKALSPADSVWLSFYYQPQGYGDVPSSDDSLILDFGYYVDVFDYFDSTTVFLSNYIAPDDTVFPGDTIQIACDLEFVIVSDTLYFEDFFSTPCDSVFRKETVWTRIWGAPGDSLESFADQKGSWFDRVMIPVADSLWFRDDFQFRFRNYGSLAAINSWKSNTDHWNIDNVRLDRNRSWADTTIRDVTFAGNPPSFIGRYRSMPYFQYSYKASQFMADSVEVNIANLDSAAHECEYSYYFIDDNDTIFEYEGGVAPVFPFFNNGYSDYTPFSKPPVKVYFPTNPGSTDSVAFKISHMIRDTETGALGDTMEFVQIFANYFAYDDGTAEAGYGLAGTGAQLAYRFELVFPDTLRAIRFYFNKVQNQYNEQLFDIAVWNDNNGVPGTIRLLEENILPEFDTGINNIYTHHLSNDSMVFNGKIYIGWIQNSTQNLNIGYDRNNNAGEHIFYNVDGTWINSSYSGSLMMRPVFGNRLLPPEPPQQSSSLKSLEIFPNPPGLSGELHLRLPDELDRPDIIPQLETRIYNLMGQLIRAGRYEEILDVSFLEEGLYLITVSAPGSSKPYSTKLLIGKRH